MWRLTLVGDMASDRRGLRRARTVITEHGLETHVVFRGCLDGERLKAIYSRSHVFAMPFAHESFGIAALDLPAAVIGLDFLDAPAKAARGLHGRLARLPGGTRRMAVIVRQRHRCRQRR